MIAWDIELIQAIARRRSVIVIGAGVSRNSVNRSGERPETWEGFLKLCASDLGNPSYILDLISNKDYLTACEVLKNKLTPDRFIALVQRVYQSKGYTPAKIHEYIYNLDSSIVVSPNFDNIYDTYALNVSAGTLVIKDHVSIDIATYLHGGDTRLLIKTHGSANNPQQLIFTRNDYAEARTKYVLFYEIMKSLILTHTFFFIGCGTDDPDIRMLFEDVKFAHGRIPYHYMTLPEGEVHDEVLKVISDSMRIKFLKYSSDNGHEELTLSLEELVNKVDESREQIAVDRKW